MQKTIDIQGMHCVSCEILLKKELEKIPGVRLIMVSYKKGILQIEYKQNKDYDTIVSQIESNGFQVSSGIIAKKSKKDILTPFLFFFLFGVIFWLIQKFEVFQYMPNINTVTYSGAILIGIVASVSTCLAITGGVIIGISQYIDSTHSRLGHIKVQLLLQLGRIVSFFLFGGILGLAGQFININFGVTSWGAFIIGLLLVYIGLNILGVLPSLSRFGIHMPKYFATKIDSFRKPKYAPIAGALTFFLPCGFTQAIQIIAIGSATFFGGAFIMLFYALGTFPVLFALGLGSTYFQDKKIPFLHTFIAFLLILFGLLTVSNTYNVISNYQANTPENINRENNIKNENIFQYKDEALPKQVIHVGHNGWHTIPREVVLESGKNYEIIIIPQVNGIGCMSTQLIPKILSKTSYVRAGQKIVYNFPNALIGTYEIVCASMGMLQGRIIFK